MDACSVSLSITNRVGVSMLCLWVSGGLVVWRLVVMFPVFVSCGFFESGLENSDVIEHCAGASFSKEEKSD
jgi:hypothetical protein